MLLDAKWANLCATEAVELVAKHARQLQKETIGCTISLVYSTS